MADAARREYRALVYETPGFVDFWRAVTPIDEISALHIGSRPTARRGGGLQPTAIRAIPWVFSWMQSRFNLPGLIERSHHPAGDLARAARQTHRLGSTPARVSVAPKPGFTVA